MTSPMCSRRTPWRSTQAFWGPMATMNPNPVPKPVRAEAGPARVVASAVVITIASLGSPRCEAQCIILQYMKQPFMHPDQLATSIFLF